MRRPPNVHARPSAARSVAQLENNVAALERLDFTAEELSEIDGYASESAINIWADSSEA